MKYKVFGLTLIGFISFLFFLLLKPKEGIDKELLKSSNIDSIGTYNLEKGFSIVNRTEINQVVNLLQNAIRVEIENPKAFKNFYDLYFYTNSKKESIDLRISKHQIDGIVIIANDHYYKGATLDSLIKVYINN